MIENGVLENPDVDCAMMLHVLAGFPLETGTVIIPADGVGAPAADYFTINVQGKGCHGSTPHLGVDSITVAAHILLGLQEISARELGVSDEALITIGLIEAGTAGNVIADTAILEGTMRAYDDNVREYIKKRITEICSGIAVTFRGQADVVFGAGCPTLINDDELSAVVEGNTKELLEEAMVLNTNSFGTKTNKSGGSEDFSYISHKVPSVMIALAAGNSEEGYIYPQHHPRVTFDEAVLPVGCAVLTYNAIKLTEKFK
jgi:hippurate hydrolase